MILSRRACALCALGAAALGAAVAGVNVVRGALSALAPGIGGMLAASLAVVILSLAAVAPPALGVARERAWSEPGPVEAWLLLVSATPALIVGMTALVWFVERAGLGFSLVSGALGLALMNLPFAALGALQAVRQDERSAGTGALALGVPEARVFRDIVLPASAGALARVALRAAARAFGETAVLMFTAGVEPASASPRGLMGGSATLAVRLWYLTSQGQGTGAQARACALWLTVIGVALALAGRPREAPVTERGR